MPAIPFKNLSKYIFSLTLFIVAGWAPSASALVVLQYHHISDKTPKSTSTSTALFEAHLQYLEDNQFNVMDIRELRKLIKKKATPPDRTVIITFDDGYRSVYDNAYPLLKKRK